MDAVTYSNLTIVVRTAHGEIISTTEISEPQTQPRTRERFVRTRRPVFASIAQWFAGFGNVAAQR
jgi:hypothetical protein